MIVVEGKRCREMTADELADRVAASGAVRTLIDVGTGDGRFAYAQAAARPDTFAIGIDAIAERLDELSAKAARKPAKGGLPNVLFVRASAESPPAELHGQAGEVDVLLPWGALLVGTMLAEPAVMEGLAALANPAGAVVRVVFNAEVWEDSTPHHLVDLPAVTVEYVESVLRPAYERFGIELGDAHELSAEEIRALTTTWARRLAHGRHPKFVAASGRFRPG